MSKELAKQWEEFQRGDYVKVLHVKTAEGGEVVDWWRPALWLGWDGNHNVLYTNQTMERLKPIISIEWRSR